MRLINETILGVLITGLSEIAKIPIDDLLFRYERLFQKYVDLPKLKGLLESEMPVENWAMIRSAKELAASNNGLKRNNSSSQPLCSIFSNLSLDGIYPQKMYYPPTVLSMEDTIPRPYHDAKGYTEQNVIEGFLSEMDSLKQISPKTFDGFLIIMDTLMKKYFWSIPAGEDLEEDIPFYDHIKTAMAITAAQVRSGQKETPFIIAAGHFSGIQSYIFSVSRSGSGGVAKRLRARSFYVNAMVSALAHSIIHISGLPMLNILMLTGGKFYILLPNTEEMETGLQKIEKQVSEFLYKKFRGNLLLELVWEKITHNGIRNYSSTLTKLSEKLRQKKDHLLETILIKNGEWDTERFVIYQGLSRRSMCTACRSALIDENDEMCDNCCTDTEIGGKLPKINMFSFSREIGQYQLLDGYYLNLDISAGAEKNYLIMNLNDTNIDSMYDKPVTIYHAVNHVPITSEGGSSQTVKVKTFSEIADGSVGSKKIGILKADVDTLGFLFSEGLRRENDEPISIARINTLSRMLDLFFGGYLSDLIKNRYKDIYCVFSGGDDLFFIGPWSSMPTLAVDINESFHRYTGNNPCMTLSMAICMAESGGHIATLADHCENRLEEVKKGSDQIISPDKNGRNGIYFFGKIISWEDLKKQLKCGDDFVQAIPTVGISFLRRLAIYSSMYQEYLKNKDTEKLVFLPLFFNDMKRNLSTLKKAPHFLQYCDALYKKVSDHNRIEKEFYYLELSVKYALHLTKEEREHG